MELSSLLVILGLLFLGAWLVRWLWKHGPIWRGLLVLGGVGFCWSLYSAYYPSESFYGEELQRLTKVDLPSGVVFLEKEVSFPDHFGDYSACFIVRLPPSAMEEFKSKLGVGSVSKEPVSGCNPGAPKVSSSEALAFDLTARATREDAIIAMQLVPSENLAKVSWGLW